MKTKKIIVVVLASLMLVMIMFIPSLKKEQPTVLDSAVTLPELNKLSFSKFDGDTEAKNAEIINLNEIDTEQFELTGGDYILKGEYNGTLNISASEEKVHLILDNVKIESKNGPALIVKNADKIVITLAENSKNYLSDSPYYDNSLELDACLSSECSVTINGKGYLKITGLHKDALDTKDTLKIIDAEVDSECKRNSFEANDGIRIDNAKMFIESEKNGFVTTKSDLNDRGFIVIDNSDISIISGRVSFVSKADLYILNSDINHRSVVALYEVAKNTYIEEGCVK